MSITGESALVDRLEGRDCGAGGRPGSMGLWTGGKRLRDARRKGAKEAGEKGERYCFKGFSAMIFMFFHSVQDNFISMIGHSVYAQL